MRTLRPARKRANPLNEEHFGMTTVAIVLAIAKRKSSRTMNEETTHEEFPQIDRSARISTLVFRWFNTSAAIIVGAIAWGVWARQFIARPPGYGETEFFVVLLTPMFGLHLPLLIHFLGSKRYQAALWSIAFAPIASFMNFILCLLVLLFARDPSTAVVITSLIWLFPFVHFSFADEKTRIS